MNWNEIEPTVERLRAETISAMKRIQELSRKNEKLSSPATSFSQSLAKLENPQYDVVVCGEVKKGKSSLLNAIVGKEILPVNNEIATSQVFRISNSSEESFFLVFTDGTRHQISQEELSRYGSQVDANLYGEPIFKDHTLSYIQVNVPVTFLPEGVNIVDTPGLGAMYKSHEWITHNYVSKASAVVFVFDPERPIVEKEKEFISKVLEITPHILFAMTKVDMYSDDVCQSIIARNEEIIALIYAEKGLTAPHIYPVSSTALMKVSTGKIDVFRQSNLRNSHFLEFKEQLLCTIYKAVGILQTGLALRESADHIVKCKSIIDDLLKVTTTESAQEQQNIKAEKVEKQEYLNSVWGSQSECRRQAQKEIHDICNSISSRVQQVVSTSGSVFRCYEDMISNLSTMEQAQKLAEIMPNEVINDVASRWETIAQESISKVTIVLEQVNTEMRRVGYESIGREGNGFGLKDLSFSERLSAARGGYFVAGAGTTVAISLSLFAIPVIGPIIGAAIGIAGWFVGRRQMEENQLNRNKQHLNRKLVELLNDLASQLLHVQGESNRSVVGAFASDLRENAESAIQDLFEEQKRNMQKELADLEEQARVDLSTRQQEIASLTTMKSEWSDSADSVKQLIVLRNQIAGELGLTNK